MLAPRRNLLTGRVPDAGQVATANNLSRLAAGRNASQPNRAVNPPQQYRVADRPQQERGVGAVLASQPSRRFKRNRIDDFIIC